MGLVLSPVQLQTYAARLETTVVACAQATRTADIADKLVPTIAANHNACVTVANLIQVHQVHYPKISPLPLFCVRKRSTT